MAFLGLIPTPTTSVKLTLSAEEAQREAVGKALMMIGTTIGLVGSMYQLSVNPSIKAKAEGLWAKLPKSMQENKIQTFTIMGVGGALLLAYLIRRATQNLADTRYK